MKNKSVYWVTLPEYVTAFRKRNKQSALYNLLISSAIHLNILLNHADMRAGFLDTISCGHIIVFFKVIFISFEAINLRQSSYRNRNGCTVSIHLATGGW